MRISVLIPAYNAAKFIAASIESVLCQTHSPDEILVLDDGSQDDTISILNHYRPRVSIFRQGNRGAAVARNELCKRAGGDLIAFLDADDLWHPKYLEVQRDQFLKYPQAVALFTGHVNFSGEGDYSWTGEVSVEDSKMELITSVEFFQRYNQAAGPFASMTYCCMPKKALRRLGNEPFCATLRGAEDSYVLYLLCLHGPVAYTPLPLAAYRIWEGSLSQNRVYMYRIWVKVFEILENKFAEANQPRMFKAFQFAFASKRRQLAKVLLGAKETSEARHHLWQSVADCPRPLSMVKSFGLLGLSYFPRKFQPVWPSGQRQKHQAS